MGASLLTATNACVIGEPDFTPPERTRPQLIAVTPPTTELLRITPTSANTFAPLNFTVQLVSEDAGDDVEAALLLNYGHPSTLIPGTPYENAVDNKEWPAGTLADGPRPLTLTWPVPQLINESHICKSLTVIATHSLYGFTPYRDCPTDIADSDTLTWFVALCENLSDCSIDDCIADRPPEGYKYCPEDPAAAVAELEP